MDAFSKRKLAAGTVAAVAVAGGSGAIAATQLGSSPSAESKAVVDDAAKQLGVQPSALSSALKKALSDRVDAAVAAGRLTKQQGEELKQRIQSDGFPLFGPPAFGFGFGHFGPLFHGLDAAAAYLGLTESELRTQLNGGKTLAQIAKDRGKTVDGLVAALKDNTKKKLDEAVAAGRLTKAQEEQILGDLDQRLNELVNAKLVLRFHGDGRGFPRVRRSASVPRRLRRTAGLVPGRGRVSEATSRIQEARRRATGAKQAAAGLAAAGFLAVVLLARDSHPGRASTSSSSSGAPALRHHGG